MEIYTDLSPPEEESGAASSGLVEWLLSTACKALLMVQKAYPSQKLLSSQKKSQSQKFLLRNQSFFL